MGRRSRPLIPMNLYDHIIMATVIVFGSIASGGLIAKAICHLLNY